MSCLFEQQRFCFKLQMQYDFIDWFVWLYTFVSVKWPFWGLRVKANETRRNKEQKGNLDQNIDWFEMKVTTKVIENENKLMKGKALRKQSLHNKTESLILLKLFISGNE